MNPTKSREELRHDLSAAAKNLKAAAKQLLSVAESVDVLHAISLMTKIEELHDQVDWLKRYADEVTDVAIKKE
ncbi:MAG: hypothetical protein ACRYF9_27950 [Janthinobacterium lividum]